MNQQQHASPSPKHSGPFGWWRRTPLYLRILLGLILGLILGLVMHLETPAAHWLLEHLPPYLKAISTIILRFLGALAPALILVAVLQAVITAELPGRRTARLAFLLTLNTIVAILIGLLVANVVRPGRLVHLPTPPAGTDHIADRSSQIAEQLLETIPRSLVEPLVTNNVIGIVIIALVFAIALRQLANGGRDIGTATALIALAYDAIVVVLHWVIALVPLAVFCTVAGTVATQGLAPFAALAFFIVAVLLALALQSAYYLLRVRFGSWVRPLDLVRGTRDALVMAFSTASSTATMPVTYEALIRNVGLRPQSASLGALVGSNFNNDGTALYEAMAALFVAQMRGIYLTPVHQVLVVLTSVIASVGAAGIPEAGLVTMTLVFRAVGLPLDYIILLLPVDWFLDRCRTMINVMGDMNVSCLLDGKTPAGPAVGDEKMTAEGVQTYSAPSNAGLT
jgi:Na+/H+-dicarboxylate symporter